jgi:hypothetical protein
MVHHLADYKPHACLCCQQSNYASHHQQTTSLQSSNFHDCLAPFSNDAGHILHTEYGLFYQISPKNSAVFANMGQKNPLLLHFQAVCDHRFIVIICGGQRQIWPERRQHGSDKQSKIRADFTEAISQKLSYGGVLDGDGPDRRDTEPGLCSRDR